MWYAHGNMHRRKPLQRHQVWRSGRRNGCIQSLWILFFDSGCFLAIIAGRGQLVFERPSLPGPVSFLRRATSLLAFCPKPQRVLYLCLGWAVSPLSLPQKTLPFWRIWNTLILWFDRERRSLCLRTGLCPGLVQKVVPCRWFARHPIILLLAS